MAHSEWVAGGPSGGTCSRRCGVVRSGDNLSRRIDGLLTEARADVQSREFAPVDLDLGEFVEAITRATDGLTTDHSVRAHVEAGRRGSTFTVRLPHREDPSAYLLVSGTESTTTA